MLYYYPSRVYFEPHILCKKKRRRIISTTCKTCLVSFFNHQPLFRYNHVTIYHTLRPPACLRVLTAWNKEHCIMPGPTILARIQHSLGRAFRETGQALDRVALRAQTQAKSPKIAGDPAYIFNDHLSRHRTKMPLLRRGTPVVSDDIAYLAPCASLIGTVHIGAGSSVFYGAVLRADDGNMACGRSKEEFDYWKAMSKEERLTQDKDIDDTAGGGGIFIGENTNIQDGCIISSRDDHTTIGNGVTVGHCAQIHSATVEDNSLIGMGAILTSGSRVESMAFVAAGAVIGKNEVVLSGELWIGNPARKLRNLTEKEKKHLSFQADEYVKLASSQSKVMNLGGNIPEDSRIEFEDLPSSNENKQQ